MEVVDFKRKVKWFLKVKLITNKSKNMAKN